MRDWFQFPLTYLPFFRSGHDATTSHASENTSEPCASGEDTIAQDPIVDHTDSDEERKEDEWVQTDMEGACDVADGHESTSELTVVPDDDRPELDGSTMVESCDELPAQPNAKLCGEACDEARHDDDNKIDDLEVDIDVGKSNTEVPCSQMTMSELMLNFTTRELKDKCRHYSLMTSGNKTALAQRLADHKQEESLVVILPD